MAEIDLTPTEEMAANAARGLELRRKHGKGGTEIGVARARDISNRKNLSPETVRRMHAFFSRHEKNKAGGEDDAGYIAWLLWGGDSGQSWAKRKVEQMDKGENQRSDTYKEIAQRLGSAAKFAITKEQIRGASREELRSIEQRLQALAKSGDKNAAALLDYVEEEYNDRYRGTHSRPGAKAKMGAQKVARFRVGKDLSGGYSVVPIKSDGSVETSVYEEIGFRHSFPTADAALAKAKQMQAKYGGTVTMEDKQVSSRPGAKAEMARDLKVRKGNFTDAVAIVGQNGGGSASFYAGLILRHKDGEEQVLWMKHGYSTEKAAERAALQRFDAHVSRMSRPGAKAKFSENIRSLNADAIAFDKGLELLHVNLRSLSEKSDRIISLINQQANNPSDLAPIRSDLNALKAEAKALVRRWQFSRLGAKVKMASWNDLQLSKAKQRVKEAKEGLIHARKQVTLYTELGYPEQLLTRAKKGLDRAEAEVVSAEAELKRYSKFSRPGAKAKFGLLTSVSTLPNTGSVNNTAKRFLERLQRVNLNDYEGFESFHRNLSEALAGVVRNTNKSLKNHEYGEWTGKDLAAILQREMGRSAALTRTAEAWLGVSMMSRPGAKVANAIRQGEKVSASDDAVSRKIRKLMDEGKPQKQAVAIALDLERRGEL